METNELTKTKKIWIVFYDRLKDPIIKVEQPNAMLYSKAYVIVEALIKEDDYNYIKYVNYDYI